ncbi:MAG: response regulator [Bacillota bacterium]
MKLMIVDDERVERESMKQILTKTFRELEIILAENGQEAVQLASEHQPDIALMDIKMPEMNGLDAIRKINTSTHHIKFVMVTAYDTFDYAKQAITLGVKDYLLKPSKISDIIDTVEKVIKEVEQDQEKLQATIEVKQELAQSKKVIERDLVTQLLLGHVHDVEAPLLLDYLNKSSGLGYGVIILKFDDVPRYSYHELIEELSIDEACLIGPLYHRQLPIVVFRNEQSYRQQLTSLTREIRQRCESLKQPVNIGVSDEELSIDQLSKSYQEAVISAMETRRDYQVLFYQDLPKSTHLCERQFDDYLSQNFFDQLRLGKWAKIEKALVDISLCYESEQVPLSDFRLRLVQLIQLMGQTLEEMHMKITWQKYHFKAEDYTTLKEELKNYLHHIRDALKTYQGELNDDWFTKMTHYIETHIDEDLSLEQLSTEAKLSPIYVSKVFKERLGMNYIEFLTTCRIDEAKRRLLETDETIKAIAVDVGYHDANYFGKVFKKVTGETPNAYRKQLIYK